MNLTETEVYDWTEWFKWCAVDACTSEDTQSRLRDIISKTMHARANQLCLNGDIRTDPERKAEKVWNAMWEPEARPYRAFDTWFSECKHGTVKPRKQWVLANLESGRYSLEQSVYGGLLGREMLSVVKRYTADKSIRLRPNTVSLDEGGMDISVSGRRSGVYRDEMRWALEQLCKAFFNVCSKNPQRSYEILRVVLTSDREAVSSSTFYEWKDKAVDVLQTMIKAEPEAGDCFSLVGMPMVNPLLQMIEQQLGNAGAVAKEEK